ncbi:hypothetical protein SERLA73DRAFT_132900 [Serpula lacrymans var. lacrymans S7.3]|uniref:Hepatocellular carcinoma-associated antigen 59-domain-containing protein n=2 Tax=Serpula lacrymans var. lacrymans TaxID=341189 RepID=F8PPP6_SERL3|nr:uncharacterized protein SERLADRAFT_383135 [Serpula lacrymans var. lacrymans S7.9]EGO02104.1 hypothetical protein SERLA73DRAFT_132900 [Serpula lacrymans var. lacrymans S7.3]EGO27727.1 hypothetical protein SERLADRAFT_383135 [Serpula lacrymans var. lacrymans S7.9]
MIRKRSRPQPRIREVSPEVEESLDTEGKLPLAEILELRKLKKARRGIDASKLHKGDVKKKKKRAPEEEDQGGLKKGAKVTEDEDEEEDKDAKARRVVRANNFTQQTNALDVDKHMMAYIEENLKIRSKPQSPEPTSRSSDPQDELYNVSERWKVEKRMAEEGSVTNSLTMLTAIPEVDLGMDTRLKNIEETEKAKRMVAEERKDRKKATNDEEHLAAARFYRPNLKQKSDADIMRDAKLEAMGLPPQDESRRHHHDRPQMATDEAVMERFKKRMRK